MLEIKELRINVICRFNLYKDIVCDDNKTLWRLENNLGKRLKPLKKLTYSEKRKAYRINSVWVSRKRLLNLRYDSIENIVLIEDKLPF